MHRDGTYTDPACPTGDSSDKHNQGLLLDKTGPTANFAAATAHITNVPKTVTELAYDIRKPGATIADPRGSHCGAGAPRFDITTQDGSIFFIGCASPPPTTDAAGNGFQRLRWGASTLAFSQVGGPPVALSSLNIKSIDIVFDEGQDTGPDNFGLAILDNIDVNGVLVGHGPGRANCDDNGHGDDDGCKQDRGNGDND